MRYLVLAILAIALALPALAEDTEMVKPAADDVQLGTLHVVNNVISLADGHQTALCACGAGFEVTDKSPTFDYMGGTYYLCGEACKAKVDAMDAEMKAGAMPGVQKAVLTSERLQTNEMTMDGKKMATCACGQTFEVGTLTPKVVGDGMCMDACCGGCAEHVVKAAPAERQAMMKKVMHVAEKH